MTLPTAEQASNMKAQISKKIGIIIMVSLLAFLQAGCRGLFFDPTPKIPVIVPIDLTKADNKTEIEFKVTDEWGYDFKLEFYYINHKEDNGLDSKKARKIAGYNSYGPGGNGNQPILVGGRCDYKFAKANLGDLIDETYDCDGTIIPIHLSIYRIEDGGKRSLILRNLYMSKGRNGAGYDKRLSKHAIARVFASKLLQKGKYIAVLENPQGFPELAGRDIRLSIYSARRKV